MLKTGSKNWCPKDPLRLQTARGKLQAFISSAVGVRQLALDAHSERFGLILAEDSAWWLTAEFS